MEHVRIHITGIVQGVGMRPFVYREAVANGISGWVLNAGDGVHVEAHGEATALQAFERVLRDEAPAAASVTGIEVKPLAEGSFDASDLGNFRIIASEDDTARTTLVSPDIATCPDCLRELFDPADRRYHYPFINCTNCGPRFTIIRSLPYDRASTSMEAFPMCPACAREYADPLDRRFHAQPDACFECGPHIAWREIDGSGTPTVGGTREESDAIIGRCAELLAAGGIVAIKGLGGFHLACDAGDDGAVRELRHRKRRSNKPFAIMMRTLADAEALCEVNETERALLAGAVRPIVLLRRETPVKDVPKNADGAASSSVAPAVAFDLPELGVMLPYTPLQHLLLAACEKRGVLALVMTSGNISEEPIETDDGLAWEHLIAGGLADALLGNDRAILARYDDSVVRVVEGEVQMVRRARGYAPRPLELPSVAGDSKAPAILACGSEQKATIALTREREGGTATCFLSQHIGDVENGATFDAWHAARARFEALFDLHPTALACDLHPRYLPSQWAREQARTAGLPLVEVQHHHAHIASVIAEAAVRGEHDANEPVIGIAFDGTGSGAKIAGGADTGSKAQSTDDTDSLEPDGTIWGGEFLVADLTGFTRAAHLRAWRLPGGAASVRDPRRNAFALLHACGLLDHPGTRPLLESLRDEERAVTATMIERGLNSPLTSSMGRFLDAVAALLGICKRATYEGEPAILLEAAAQRTLESAKPSELIQEEHAPMWTFDETAGVRVLDPAPLLEQLLDGIIAGEPASKLALFVHASVAHMTCDVARDIATDTGIRSTALSGGVFMNRLLLSGIRRGLEQRGLAVLTPHDVPVNDGCIAYGQAAITRTRLTRR